MNKMQDNADHEYFVWATLPYGYARATYIAKQADKEVLIAKWCKLGEIVLVFYNNSMAVADGLFLKDFQNKCIVIC